MPVWLGTAPLTPADHALMSVPTTAAASAPGSVVSRCAVALLAWTTVVLCGCAHPRAGDTNSGARAVVDTTTAHAVALGPIVVDVENLSSYDVIVYALRGSLRQRIGSVAGISRTTVTVPATFTSDLGAFSISAVRLAGNESYISDPIGPQPGIRLRLVIQARIVNSALSIE